MSDALLHVPTSAQAYDAALEGLTALDEVILRDGQAPASLYDTGAIYKTEPTDIWRHAVDVAREKWGDCEDLSAYRAAELRVSGEDPAARVRTYPTGPHRYHAIVVRGSGIVEDPSRVLGMRVPPGKVMPATEGDLMTDEDFQAAASGFGPACMAGEDPTPENRSLTFDIYPVGKGWAGVVRLPLDLPGGSPQALFLKTSQSPTPADATVKSANLAKLIDSLPPDLKAKLPPQAAAAAAVLTNPTVVKALQNPASLLNMSAALARPDIAVQNVQKVANTAKQGYEAIKNLFG